MENRLVLPIYIAKPQLGVHSRFELPALVYAVLVAWCVWWLPMPLVGAGVGVGGPEQPPAPAFGPASAS